MRFDIQKSFGYPVLRPHSADYLKSDFQSGISLSLDERKVPHYVLSYDVAVGVKELDQLIASGRAGIQIEVTCRETFFGQVFDVQAHKGAISIPINQIRGYLDIFCYVTAKKPVNGFKSSKVNPEFGKQKISFPRHAVLACEDPSRYWVDKDFFRNITSIFDL